MDERVEPGKTEIGNVRRHIARYNLALALCDKKRVLDLACGTGYGSYIISMVAKNVMGVDISDNAIERAEKYFANDRLRFQCCSANKWINLWGQPPYDTMVCFETLEHLDNPSELEVRKVVKNGGHIIYSVPLDEEKGWNPHHKQVFNLETAREIFNLKFVDEFIQVGLNFYRMGETLPEGKQFYIGIRMV